MTVIERARAEGIILPKYAGLSAKQLRAIDPDHAGRVADFMAAHRAEYVAFLSDRISGGTA